MYIEYFDFREYTHAISYENFYLLKIIHKDLSHFQVYLKLEFSFQLVVAATKPQNSENRSKSDDKSHLYWAKGTGFGTGSTTQSWNVEQALSRQRSEEEHVTVLLQVIHAFYYMKMQCRTLKIVEYQKFPRLHYFVFLYHHLFPPGIHLFSPVGSYHKN